MAIQMTPAQMASQFKLWKVDLNLYPGWATRGYGPGSISDVEGVMIHHTGSDAGQSDDYLDFLFNRGRPPQVPPPLCNWATDMDGDLWLGAAERANHAGAGSSATLSKVESGNYDWRNVEIHPGVDNINGNARYYGNEVRFDGGQPMTRPQWVTAVLSSAACCHFHGWGAWRVIGHKEHTSRKPDPGSTHMYEFRRDVAAALKAGPGNWPTPPKEWDEMATKEEIAAVVQAELEEYAARFWVAPSGTGKALIDDVNTLRADVDQIQNAVNAANGGVWNVQIADVISPESGDTDAASSLLAYAAVNAGSQALAKLTPDLDEIKAAVAALQALLFPPEPPAPLA